MPHFACFWNFHVFVDSPCAHYSIWSSSVNLSHVNVILSHAGRSWGQTKIFPPLHHFSVLFHLCLLTLISLVGQLSYLLLAFYSTNMSASVFTVTTTCWREVSKSLQSSRRGCERREWGTPSVSTFHFHPSGPLVHYWERERDIQKNIKLERQTACQKLHPSSCCLSVTLGSGRFF